MFISSKSCFEVVSSVSDSWAGAANLAPSSYTLDAHWESPAVASRCRCRPWRLLQCTVCVGKPVSRGRNQPTGRL